MGGFPSHDAAGFLFTTTVQHPTNNGTTEVCLVPLLRRYFNDNNRALKDSLNRMYLKREALHQQGSAGAAASSLDITALRDAHGVPLPTPGVCAATAEGRAKAPSPQSLDHLLWEVEASFYMNTKDILSAAEDAKAQVKYMEETGKTQWHAAGVAHRDLDSAAPPQEHLPSHENPADASKACAEHVSPPVSAGSKTGVLPHPLLRPVPCAICVLCPDAGSRKNSNNSNNTNSSNSSGAAAAAAGIAGSSINAPFGINGGAAPKVTPIDWATIQGRKLQCIGLLSCFSEHPYVARGFSSYATHATDPRKHAAGSHKSEGSTAAETIPRISPNRPKATDVYLEVLLDQEDQHRHLLEPLVFLAGMAFRSQFLTCCMSQSPAASRAVEEAFYHHLQLLNVHVLLSQVRYWHLKLFYQLYPLTELVEGMGIGEKSAQAAASANAPSPSSVRADGGQEGPPHPEQQQPQAQPKGNEEVTPVSHDTGEDDAAAKETNSGGAAATTTGTGNSETTSGRRGRRSRRRLRKLRPPVDQDHIYRSTTCRPPSFHFYELDNGEHGVEVGVEGGILARLMKFVTEMAAFETVKGVFIRCDIGPLLKERRRLQSHHESLQDYLDRSEEDERLFGCELITAAVRLWLMRGAAEEAQRAARSASQSKPAPRAPTTGPPAGTAPVGVPAQPMYMPGVTDAMMAAAGMPTMGAGAGVMPPLMMFPPFSQPLQQPQQMPSWFGFNAMGGAWPAAGMAPLPPPFMTMPPAMKGLQPLPLPQAPSPPRAFHVMIGPNGQQVLVPACAAPLQQQPPQRQNVSRHEPSKPRANRRSASEPTHPSSDVQPSLFEHMGKAPPPPSTATAGKQRDVPSTFYAERMRSHMPQNHGMLAPSAAAPAPPWGDTRFSGSHAASAESTREAISAIMRGVLPNQQRKPPDAPHENQSRYSEEEADDEANALAVANVALAVFEYQTADEDESDEGYINNNRFCF